VITFVAATVVMTLVAITVVVVPLLRAETVRSPLAGLCAALLISATVALLYPAISTYPWSDPPLAATSDSSDPELLERQARAAADDPAAWIRLANAYLGKERFAEARLAYGRALELSGEAAPDELRLAYAEAALLADRNALAGEAGAVIDAVLERDPLNAKALWYGGLAALARGDAAGARNRWTRLLELEPPAAVRDIIEQQLAAVTAAQAAPGGEAPGAGAPASIPVRISISPDLAARVRPGAALFLIARAPGGRGPPLAVVRRDAVQLPLELEIGDADSMVPGRTISGLPQLELTARIANDGEALPATGDVYGEVLWDASRPAGQRLSILMDRVVP
jgi:cytochrome c-type biogenesis protein CcmH